MFINNDINIENPSSNSRCIMNENSFKLFYYI